MLPLHQLDLAECTFADDLERVVVLWPLARPQEPQEVGFGFAHVVLLLLLASVRKILRTQDLLQLLCPVVQVSQAAQRSDHLTDHTSRFWHVPSRHSP